MKELQAKESLEDSYSIKELFEQLQNDDSWEEDPEIRKKAIQMLKKKIASC